MTDFINGLLGTLHPAQAIRPRSFSWYDPQRPRLRGPEIEAELMPDPLSQPAAAPGQPPDAPHSAEREPRADSPSLAGHPPRLGEEPVPAARGTRPEGPPSSQATRPAAAAATAVRGPVLSHPVTPPTGPVREPVDGSPGEHGPQGPAGPRGLPGTPGVPGGQAEPADGPAPERPLAGHPEPSSALRPKAAEPRDNGAAWAARRARAQERTVEIIIDRLEVRAEPAPAAPARRSADRKPALNLDDYLRQRDKRNGVGT